MNLDGIVSLLFTCIELLIVVNLIVFSRRRLIDWLVIAFISLLMLYQFFEFLMCNLRIQNQLVIYLAFVAISFLPPLSLFLALRFLDYRQKFLRLVFLPVAFFMIYYLFTINEFEVTKCTMLYASYRYPLGYLYGIFYYAPILVAVYFLIIHLKRSKDQRIFKPIKILLISYSFFILAVVFAFVFYPYLRSFMESYLCKVAIILAISMMYFSLTMKKLNLFI